MIKLKINIKALLYCLLIYLFVFERVLAEKFAIFSYIDEILCIFIILCLVFQRNRLYKDEIKIIFGLLIICFIGVLGNSVSKIVDNEFYIIVDMISMIKVWLAFYYIRILNKKEGFFDEVLIYMAKIGRILTYIMFIFLIVSYFIDIGMTAYPRYGFKSYQFIFNNPGNFSKYFYFMIPLLTADLYYGKNVYKMISIAMTLLVWSSTMRSRALAFVAMYVMLYVFFFTIKKNSYKKFTSKIKIWYIIPLILVAILISKDQIIFYFTTDTQARAVLLRYGLLTLARFFPIGAGFGTFGSDVAATQYSKLYLEYGFNSFYGMRHNETYFLNDNFWPMIFGQFGLIGTIVMIYVLIKFTRHILNIAKCNSYFYFAAFTAMGFLLLSSVASKSYCEYSSICIFMLLGVIVNIGKKQLSKL